MLREETVLERVAAHLVYRARSYRTDMLGHQAMVYMSHFFGVVARLNDESLEMVHIEKAPTRRYPSKPKRTTLGLSDIFKEAA